MSNTLKYFSEQRQNCKYKFSVWIYHQSKTYVGWCILSKHLTLKMDCIIKGEWKMHIYSPWRYHVSYIIIFIYIYWPWRSHEPSASCLSRCRMTSSCCPASGWRTSWGSVGQLQVTRRSSIAVLSVEWSPMLHTTDCGCSGWSWRSCCNCGTGSGGNCVIGSDGDTSTQHYTTHCHCFTTSIAEA